MLFWAITQRAVVIPYRRFWTTYRVPSLKVGPIGCPETSARNYLYSLRNSPEEHRSHLYLHCTFACVLVDLHSVKWRIIKTNVSATVGLIFVHPLRNYSCSSRGSAIHGLCCGNNLSTQDEAIQFERRLFPALQEC